MTHPFFEAAIGAGVALAIGAGAAWMLPWSEPEPVRRPLAVGFDAPATVRVEPRSRQSEAARIDDLRRQLSEIAAEHRRLTKQVRALIEKRRQAREAVSP